MSRQARAAANECTTARTAAIDGFFCTVADAFYLTTYRLVAAGAHETSARSGEVATAAEQVSHHGVRLLNRR